MKTLKEEQYAHPEAFQSILKFSPGLAPITLNSPASNGNFGACSIYSPPTFSWDVLETFIGYEIMFSPDRNITLVPVPNELKLQSLATRITIPLDTWEEMMMIPGASGGIIYWRVMGTRPDDATGKSGVRSLVIRPDAAGNPTLSPTSRRSRPTLTWQTNCNIQFKVRFGSNSGFSKKTYSFEIENPDGNEGPSSKTLTFQQWMKITLLVKNKIGSSIYWYVESWDKLGRYAKTDVMSFDLILLYSGFPPPPPRPSP